VDFPAAIPLSIQRLSTPRLEEDGEGKTKGERRITIVFWVVAILLMVAHGTAHCSLEGETGHKTRDLNDETHSKFTHIYLLTFPKNFRPAKLQTKKNPIQRLPKTAAPSNNVANTLVSMISSALTSMISRSSTTKSALLPTSSEPNMSSVKDA
jgi:hypothetical protein